MMLLLQLLLLLLLLLFFLLLLLLLLLHMRLTRSHPHRCKRERGRVWDVWAQRGLAQEQ
jgi:hypothetical protein